MDRIVADQVVREVALRDKSIAMGGIARDGGLSVEDFKKL
jgi:hypothetical protein